MVQNNVAESLQASGVNGWSDDEDSGLGVREPAIQEAGPDCVESGAICHHTLLEFP